MTSKVFKYDSSQLSVHSSTNLLETKQKDGIKHTWIGYVKDCQATFILNIDWEALKIQRFDRLVGHLIINHRNGAWQPHRVDIDWTETNRSVSAMLGSRSSAYDVSFEYNLTAHYAELPTPEKVSFAEMFAASDKTDVVLIVEGKKLNVNKSFLSFHSDYFLTLFSANFKEGQMKEIEIKEVSYKDLGLLLSSFYPNPHFPNDLTVETLLEMADRFQVSSVLGIVEYHLLNNSKIGYEKMLWLADKYAMPKLLNKCINQMNSLEMAKKLEKSLEFMTLSDKTSSLIFRRLLKSI
ncbi:hypothetical protein B9Z55_006100 [Caenorhabditis nigoni]|uniref:BTB domain-containing protein n=1 Tax=Caenorhabditis nigoni TaxID=1611254 RepID=A0A2G5V3N2_9PELO|nr:hypothetical protein B9Z55_006100 [Caenorhabditis nigoni]